MPETSPTHGLMRHITSTFLAISLLLSPLLSLAGNLNPEPLPADEVVTQPGSQCVCLSFPRNKPLNDKNVVMQMESYEGPHKIRLNGKTIGLKRVGGPQGKRVFVNRFSSEPIKVLWRARETSARLCLDYLEPPLMPEPSTELNSCFIGTLTVQEGKKSSSTKIVQYCNC